MLKSVIFLSLVCVGVFGLPASKLSKTSYPKKYDEEIHSVDTKIKDEADSPYVNYEFSDQMDSLNPPSEWISYDLLPGLSVPSKYIYEVVKEPTDSFVPPPEDTYSRYNNEAILSLLPPVEDADTVKSYLGYTEVDGEMGDVLKAPEESSYSNIKTDDKDADSQSTFPLDKLSPFLLPPLENGDKLPSVNPYLDSEPSLSSYYAIYDQETPEKLEMQAPPMSS